MLLEDRRWSSCPPARSARTRLRHDHGRLGEPRWSRSKVRPGTLPAPFLTDPEDLTGSPIFLGDGEPRQARDRARHQHRGRARGPRSACCATPTCSSPMCARPPCAAPASTTESPAEGRAAAADLRLGERLRPGGRGLATFPASTSPPFGTAPGAAFARPTRPVARPLPCRPGLRRPCNGDGDPRRCRWPPCTNARAPAADGWWRLRLYPRWRLCPLLGSVGAPALRRGGDRSSRREDRPSATGPATSAPPTIAGSSTWFAGRRVSRESCG